MNDREHLILHQLAHPASARAVSIDGTKWRQNSQVLALLDWGEIFFALWKNGIAVPGPTVGNTSYWWVHDAWKSWSIISVALAPVVGEGWVEAVRRCIYHDLKNDNTMIGRGSSDGPLRTVFASPWDCCISNGAQIIDRESCLGQSTSVFPEEGWRPWSDYDLMGENDYNEAAIAALEEIDNLLNRASIVQTANEREAIADQILNVGASRFQIEAVKARSGSAIDEVHALIDAALEAEIDAAIDAFRLHSLDEFISETRSLMRRMYFGERKIAATIKINSVCEQMRTLKEKASNVADEKTPFMLKRT